MYIRIYLNTEIGTEVVTLFNYVVCRKVLKNYSSLIEKIYSYSSQLKNPYSKQKIFEENDCLLI